MTESSYLGELSLLNHAQNIRYWGLSVRTCQTDPDFQAHLFILAFVLRARDALFSGCADLCCVRTDGCCDGWLEIHSLCPVTKQPQHFMTQWTDSHFSNWKGFKGSFLFKQRQSLKRTQIESDYPKQNLLVILSLCPCSKNDHYKWII